MKLSPLTLALPALLLAACDRDGPVAPLRPEAEPLMQISDARSSGRAHFYFLPPMAAQPAYAGTFDGSVLPLVAVEVCELAGTACGAHVARFTAESQGLERVTTSQYFEHYLAIWRTDGANASVGSTYRVTVSAGEALGYADVKVVRTLAEARAVDRTQFAVALKGFPLLIRFRIETGAVFPVGPEGGIVTAAGGVVQLEFPAGAVSNVIGVTVAPATDLPADAAAPVAGTAFDFGPDGATFAAPVKLTIRYPNATPDEAQLRLHKLVGNAWQMVANSTVDVENNSVSGDVSGFSEYAVLLARPDPGLVGHIAFVSGTDLFLVKEDGGNLTNLTNIPAGWGAAFSPAWSPTGDKLAFFRYSSGIDVIGATAADLKSISALIYDSRPLTWGRLGALGDLFWDDGYEGFAANSATGAVQTVSFTRQPHSFLRRDFPHPDDGPVTQHRIACDGGSGGRNPLPSPDGTLIAFMYRESCVYADRPTFWAAGGGMGFANPATGEVIADFAELNPYYQLVCCGSYDEGEIKSYAWSTGGDKLAVVVDAGETSADALFLVDIANRKAVPLLTKGMLGQSCQDPWPSDDEFLCGGDLQLARLREDFQFAQHRSLAWSPVGDKLAFSMSDPPDADGNIEDSDGVADYDIWILDLSVTPHVLTRLAGNSAGDEWDPTWSPDGKKIAFVSDRHSNRDDPSRFGSIYVLDLATSVVERLTTNEAHTPRWRP